MKIGIISMQKVVNYGSFMQAFALKSILEEISSEKVFFIDIENGKKIIQCTRKDKIRSMLLSIKNGLFFEKVRDKIYLKKLGTQFKNYFYNLLDLKDEYNSDKYDLAVIGSDEVFHCCQNTAWGFTKQLYGDVRNASQVISYAGSFGATTSDLIEKYGLTSEIAESLNKLKGISVRDDNSYEIIKKLVPQANVERNLDPVLLYDFSKKIDETPDVFPKEKYLVVYSYTGRISNSEEIKAIKEFAKSRKLKIYTIFCRYKWADKAIIPESPFQMLRWFSKAEYVVSDTFHGTIFSIITHKKFCTLVRDSNHEKLSSLLESFKLKDRMIFNANEIKDKIEISIDYDFVDEIRKKELERTMKYLEKFC